jgi:hypothetical protein
MKKNLVYLLSALALFTSCSSAYKTTQTPDDVYYSPGQKIIPADDYVNYSSSDDNYLRMKAQDYEKWSSLDDYDYWYDSRYYANNYYSPWTPTFSLGIGVGYYNMYPYYAYSPYWYNPWHSCYNPYYTVVYYKNPAVYYRPVTKSTLSTYNNRNYNTYNMPLQTGNRSSMYVNSNSNLYRTKSNDFNPNHNYNSNPVRMFSSGSSSFGGGARISGGGMRSRP